MKNILVTLNLDPTILRQVQILAKDEKRTLEDEATWLLEKGIFACEFLENEDYKTNKEALC